MADNISITPGTGANVAADDVGGVLHQRVKVSVGEDGSAIDVSQSNPLPVSDNILALALQRLSSVLTTLQNILLSPLGYDKSIQRQRGTVIVESGTVTTCTTCATVTNLSQIDSFQGRLLINANSVTAWRLAVRSIIT